LAVDLDVLIITGGDDSVLRRAVELKIAGQMTLRRKPVVGICHGAFLLADVLGSKIIEVDGHHNTEHCVNYFGEIQTVNSFHNLAITELHKSATPLVQDQDGNCEAWIDGLMAGVVWHPERMKEPWLPDEIKNLLFNEH
jgi:gamma-glutamyl-gamma-aminobutyrate hydrolase PuuD